MRRGIPAHARDIRTMLETPQGRTCIVCVGETRDFATWRGEFIALAPSTTPNAAPAVIKP